MRRLSPSALMGPPLVLAARGGTFVGGRMVEHGGEAYHAGAAWVEWLIPADLRHPLPLLLLHGGGGQGTDYLTTPDGRPGWAERFARAGFAVYVMDRPGHGRSALHPALSGDMTLPLPLSVAAGRFAGPSHAPKWPQAGRHDQWPGSGREGDPALAQLMAASGPAPADLARGHLEAQAAGAEVVRAIGPVVLVTHSAGAPAGWAIADACPDVVRAVVAVEPLGPPFLTHATGAMAQGIAAAGLTFDPPLAPGKALARAPLPAPADGLLDTEIQAEPARRLSNLAEVPVAVVVAEASWMAQTAHATAAFLRQAGVPADLIRLEDHGLHGNGHMVMSEKNSDTVADLLAGWILRATGAEARPEAGGAAAAQPGALEGEAGEAAITPTASAASAVVPRDAINPVPELATEPRPEPDTDPRPEPTPATGGAAA